MNFIKPLSRRYQSSILKVTAYILVVMAVGMVPCLLFDVANGYSADPFLCPMIFCFLVGIILLPKTKLPTVIRPVDGILMIGIVWLVAILLGSVPFYLAGMDIFDSIFESTSGFTTTGSTIMEDIESWPPGILLWRSMMQWMGGIAIIMIFMFLLPSIGIGGREFFGSETSGSGTGTLSIKLRDAAIQFSMIYAGLTAILIALLLFCNVGFFDSLCLSFSTVSTGGFMCKNDSLASFSPIVKMLASIFMFLGGTNFYLHFKAIRNKDPGEHIHNEEFKFMFIWTIVLIVGAVLFHNWTDASNGVVIDDGVFDVILNVVSAATTTGFAASDYSGWWTPVIALIFAAMIIGASTGSTSGGLKIGRLLIVTKYTFSGIKNNLHPKAVYDVRLNGSTVDKSGISSAVSIVVLFFLTILSGTIILIFFGFGFSDAFTVMVANLTTFGPAVGVYGPMGSYATIPWFAKLFLSLVMWLGRLEIITGLVLVTPTFWKELMMSRRKKLGKPMNRGFRR